MKINAYPTPYHWHQSRLQYAKYVRQFELAKRYIRKDAVVLDYGCGDGKMISIMGNYFRRVYGVDNQNKALNFARSLVKKKNVFFKKNTGVKIPFPSEEFDAVLSFDVIEHLPPDQVAQYLFEIRRVLKKGGVCVLTTPNRRSVHNRLFGHVLVDKHYQEFSLKELMQQVEDAQCTVIAAHGIFLEPIFKLEKIGCRRPLFYLLKIFIAVGAFFPSLSEKILLVAKK